MKIKKTIAKMLEDGFVSEKKFSGSLQFYNNKSERILYDPGKDRIVTRYYLKRISQGIKEGDTEK